MSDPATLRRKLAAVRRDLAALETLRAEPLDAADDLAVVRIDVLSVFLDRWEREERVLAWELRRAEREQWRKAPREMWRKGVAA